MRKTSSMFQSTGVPNSRRAKVVWHPGGNGGLPLLSAVEPDPSHEFHPVVNLEDIGEYSEKDNMVDATVGGRRIDFDQYEGQKPSLVEPLLVASKAAGQVDWHHGGPASTPQPQRYMRSAVQPDPSHRFDRSDEVVNREDDGKWDEEDYGVDGPVDGRQIDFDRYQGRKQSELLSCWVVDR